MADFCRFCRYRLLEISSKQAVILSRREKAVPFTSFFRSFRSKQLEAQREPDAADIKLADYVANRQIGPSNPMRQSSQMCYLNGSWGKPSTEETAAA